MRYIAFFILFIGGGAAQAQVANNNIEDRLELSFQEKIHSSTNGSTVQWKCINKSLTNKCLVYHNDQWFSFKVEKAGKYYLNLSSQQCRDNNGVQLIIIEGNPCETQSYKILQCISQIRSEDVFVELDDLKPNTSYLVNVDGFLGDFCEFDIELSDEMKGLPRAPVSLESLNMNAMIKQRIVTMDWTIDDNQAREISEFRIVRKFNKNRGEQLSTISLAGNAYGKKMHRYYFADTLADPGTYIYHVYGARWNDGMPLLLAERTFELIKQVRKATPTVISEYALKLRFKEGEVYKVRLYNYEGDQLLWKQAGRVANVSDPLMIDPKPFVARGIRKFQLLVLDEGDAVVEELYLVVGGDGSVRKE